MLETRDAGRASPGGIWLQPPLLLCTGTETHTKPWLAEPLSRVLAGGWYGGQKARVSEELPLTSCVIWGRILNSSEF